MCGIFLVINPTNQVIEIFTEAIASRGPDHRANVEIQTINSGRFILGGSVLHIQGKDIISQPYIDHFGNILLWNGEMFDGNLSLTQDNNSDSNNVKSDTLIIANALHTKLADNVYAVDGFANGSPVSERNIIVVDAIQKVLRSIQGPYSFIYYHKLSNTIHYGRDPFGRRSLLCLQSHEIVDNITYTRLLALCSVKPNDANNTIINHYTTSIAQPLITATTLVWSEVNVQGTYSISLSSSTTSSSSALGYYEPHLTPWPNTTLRLGRQVAPPIPSPIPPLDSTPIPPPDSTPIPTPDLNNSLNRYTTPERYLEISTVLYELLLKAVQKRQNTIQHSYTNNCTAYTNNADNISTHTNITDNGTLSPPTTNTTTSTPADTTLSNNTTSTSTTLTTNVCCRTGVLFSGGIDSVILACLLHLSIADPLEPIELINVSFYNTLEKGHKSDFPSGSMSPSPDRLAAIVALDELKVFAQCIYLHIYFISIFYIRSFISVYTCNVPYAYPMHLIRIVFHTCHLNHIYL